MRALAVTLPLVAGFAVVEYLASRASGKASHDLRDSLGNIGCGLLDQATALAVYPFLFLIYTTALAHLAVVQLPADAVWAWILGFVLTDLVFYGFHRLAHQVNAMWAVHVVHHQSGRFNLTVGMRNGAFQRLLALWFYLPLAVIGMPAMMLVVLVTVSLSYQFLMHTRFFATLGPLDWVLNTPSHHRVHHGVDADYVDKNFGGVLIVWDRLFGTFQAEHDEPTYGVSNPAWRCHDPVRANLRYFAWLLEQCRRHPAQWAKIWLGRPTQESTPLGQGENA